jgi:2-phospho-L-lactate guanylyltransferase (CobY/MobA/RfbA family)
VSEQPRRWVVVLATSLDGRGAPPGIDPHAFALANLEDTYEVAAGLNFVRATIACPPEHAGSAASVLWSGAEVLPIGDLRGVLARLAELGATQAAVLSADAPDLPALAVGKLFRALGRADLAISPCVRGHAVALAANLPLADWLDDVDLDFDDAGLLQRLNAAAPRRTAVATTPGWHRLTEPAALAFLDPGLEGWESTRALLEQSAHHAGSD